MGLNRIAKSRAWVDACNLEDLGFIGSKYTWRRGGVHERIDRALLVIRDGFLRLKAERCTIFH